MTHKEYIKEIFLLCILDLFTQIILFRLIWEILNNHIFHSGNSKRVIEKYLSPRRI